MFFAKISEALTEILEKSVDGSLERLQADVVKRIDEYFDELGISEEQRPGLTVCFLGLLFVQLGKNNQLSPKEVAALALQCVKSQTIEAACKTGSKEPKEELN